MFIIGCAFAYCLGSVAQYEVNLSTAQLIVPQCLNSGLMPWPYEMCFFVFSYFSFFFLFFLRKTRILRNAFAHVFILLVYFSLKATTADRQTEEGRKRERTGESSEIETDRQSGRS